MRESISYGLIFIVGMLGMVLYTTTEPRQDPLQRYRDRHKIELSDTVELSRTTFYNAVVAQCDNDPFTTADGSHIDVKKLNKGELRWVALSQDLIDDAYKARRHPGLFKGNFEFGDTITVESKKYSCMNGCYVVRDVMNRRYRKSMDFLLPLKKHYKFGLGNDFRIFKTN